MFLQENYFIVCLKTSDFLWAALQAGSAGQAFRSTFRIRQIADFPCGSTYIALIVSFDQ